MTHLVTGQPIPGFTGPAERAGSAVISRLATAQPRARLMGRPTYVADEAAAGRALEALGAAIRDRLIVEDPDRPVAESAEPRGTAVIVVDDPEHVEVDADNQGDAPTYLVLADTFDPGWSATLDGQPAPIRPAFAAFRAVLLPPGRHRVAFAYEPAGFRVGLLLTAAGLTLAAACLLWPRPVAPPDPPHGPTRWPRWWPAAFVAALVLFVVASTVRPAPGGGLAIQARWEGAFHRFTWAAGIEAIKPMSRMIGR